MKTGRPPIIKHTPMLVSVMAELLRDRRNGRERASARDACNRLEKQLAQDFQGGRILPFNTVHRYYKEFKKTVRRSNSGEELASASNLLTIGRERREVLGWNASVWLFVMEPEFLEAKGHNVITPLSTY